MDVNCFSDEPLVSPLRELEVKNNFQKTYDDKKSGSPEDMFRPGLIVINQTGQELRFYLSQAKSAINLTDQGCIIFFMKKSSHGDIDEGFHFVVGTEAGNLLHQADHRENYPLEELQGIGRKGPQKMNRKGIKA